MSERELKLMIYNLKRIYYYFLDEHDSLKLVSKPHENTVEFFASGVYAFRIKGDTVNTNDALQDMYNEITRNFPEAPVQVVIKREEIDDITWRLELWGSL